MSGLRKTHKTAVVVVPPESVWPAIQALRQRYDRHFRRWMPHITLLYPFRPRLEFPNLLEPLARACAGVEAFEVTLTQFRFFPHGGNRFTAWLAPEPSAPLRHLQACLQQVVPECDDLRRFPGGYTPHLSVGQIRGAARLKQLLVTWHETWSPLRFTVRDVCLLWRNDPPDDVFRVETHLPLG